MKELRIKPLRGENKVFFNTKHNPLIPEEDYEKYKEELDGYKKWVEKDLANIRKREKR